MSAVERMSTAEAIRARRTTKVLSSSALPVVDDPSQVDELVELAGWAPFHRACDSVHREGQELGGIEPWRIHALNATSCRQLGDRLPADISGKIPAMLAAADALLMVTWLPNPPSTAGGVTHREVGGVLEPGCFTADSSTEFEPTLGNMEHIAAAAAAVQNLLIAATARGIATYWSSGGVLRCSAAFDLMGISRGEILLAAIFLFPAEVGSAEVVGSKLREHRSHPEQWSRKVHLQA
jgi:nitroreductase